ncbi:MAG: glycosyltransferase involved in cell wall biosynthesis [Urechidicola sp.]|jgi:glycosyltransferase involved in cell wall biosynthesis
MFGKNRMKPEEKTIYLISSLDYDYPSAAKKRINSYMLAIEASGYKPTLCTLKNGLIDFKKTKKKPINNSKSPIEIYKFVKYLNELFSKEQDIRVLLYPTSFILFDIYFLIYFSFRKNIKVFIEVNEVRRYNVSYNQNRLISLSNIKIFLIKILYTLNDLFYKLCNGQIYISDKIKSFYNFKSSIVIPILCNSYPEKIKSKTYIKHDVFNIGFAGTIDLDKEKMFIFFEACDKLIKKGFHIKINLYGYFPNQKEFYMRIGEYSEFIKYSGVIESSKIKETLLFDNELLILPRGYSKQNYYGFSTKLTEYLETQLPILTTDIGDIGKYFKDGVNCFIYKHDDIKNLEVKLEYIINNYNNIKDVIIGGNDLLKKSFYFNNYSNKLTNFLIND